MSDVILTLENITKEFPGVKALENVSFDLRKNEVHVLVGENGAGKSTLMKVLTGVYQPNDGKIFLHGKEVRFLNTRQSQENGIAIIFQEFNLIPNLTVVQNMFLGRELRNKLGLIDMAAQVREAKKLLDFLRAEIDPYTKVRDLGVAQQQMVEVAKALLVDAEIIVMDEPTAALSEREIETLFMTIKDLQKRGVSIIYISHRMQELRLVGDRITVLRDGKTVGTRDMAHFDLDEIIKMMVGRDVNKERVRKVNTSTDEVVLEVKNLSVNGSLSDISLRVNRGEIVSLAGLVGSGRTELAQAIFGVTKRDAGEVRILDEQSGISPVKSVNQKMAFISEDRKRFGLALNLPIKVNITHASLQQLFPSGIVNEKKENAVALDFRQRLNIVTPDVDREVLVLSGGNQQKVILAKWLCTNSNFMIFDEPTRGIDVGAKDEIHQLMNQLAERGVAILMISSDLPEIMTLSDRVYVMRDGKIVQELNGYQTSQEEIISYAVGGDIL